MQPPPAEPTPPAKGITPRRLARLRGTLARRQPDLAVVVENVHDPHNVSAMLRSCDAVGADGAHLVYTDEELPEINRVVSASAQRWLDCASTPASRNVTPPCARRAWRSTPPT